MTSIVNAYGCMVLLKTPILEGQPVEIVNKESQEARGGRVVWCGGTVPGGLTEVGLEIEEMDEKFWGSRYVEFLLWMAKST